jgi:hypothetical protein
MYKSMNAPMKKIFGIGLVVLGVVVVIIGSVLYVKSRTNSDTQNTLANTPVQNGTGSPSSSTSRHNRVAPAGMKVYENSSYKFSLIYPLSYTTNKLYSIWGNPASGDAAPNREFGINKGTETIFAISVYEKVSDTKKIAELRQKIIAQKTISNGTKASILKGYEHNLLIDSKDFVYIIYSSYADKNSALSQDQNLPEWQQYQDILSSLVIWH